MIVEGLIDLFINIMLLVCDTISLVPLPVALMDVLFDILCYGTWIIGADFMAIFLTCVVGWFAARFTIGVVVFVWELLPFT